MSSAVYYRFRSQKSQHRINFDGTGISVFDLKRDILLANKLETTASSFDLRLTNPDTGEVYEDDSEVLPRATSVEVRRVPIIRQGDRNSAGKYISGNLMVSGKNAARRENFKRPAGAMDSAMPMVPPSGSGGPEDEMMQAVFAAQGEQWRRTQEEMAEKAPVYYNSDPNANKPPPPNYICFRCGQKGHWITQCPSIDDVKRVRKTTGIPKSMLRTVEKPVDGDNSTYLINADGEYVVAVADEKSWQDFQKRQRMVQEKQAKRLIPTNLQDPITGNLIVDPKKTPCCGKTYSDASIQEALISSEFECPNCNTKDVYIDQLVVDNEMEGELEAYNGQQGQVSANATETKANVEESDEYDFRRRHIRRSSTSTFPESDSESSRSSSGAEEESVHGPEGLDGLDGSTKSDHSEISTGAVLPPAGAKLNSGNAAPVQQPGAMPPMFPPFMMSPFMMNQNGGRR